MARERMRGLDAARDALRRGDDVLAASDANVDARFHLGNLLREQGRAAEAIDAYRWALALAHDADQRRSVRDRLAQNRRTHPLFDMARFTEALETAFLTAAG